MGGKSGKKKLKLRYESKKNQRIISIHEIQIELYSFNSCASHIYMRALYVCNFREIVPNAIAEIAKSSSFYHGIYSNIFPWVHINSSSNNKNDHPMALYRI